MRIGIGVPVLSNFKGFTELMHSLNGLEHTIYVANNWINNIGVGPAWNEFIHSAIIDDLDLLVICNDDVVWKSFDMLLHGWMYRPDNALIVTGTHGEEKDAYAPHPDYSCFGFNPLAMNEIIGDFDENFAPAYFEDNDHHYRIKLAGFEAYSYGLAQIEHKGSQTQNADPNKPVVTSEMFEKNREYYNRKWGGWPGQETFVHPFNNPNNTLKDW